MATGQDSMNDVISTSAVLAGTLLAHFTGIQVDGYMGVGVAVFIIYSGYRLVTETLNPLLGLAPDPDLVKSLEKKILSYPQILGLHDLKSTVMARIKICIRTCGGISKRRFYGEP